MSDNFRPQFPISDMEIARGEEIRDTLMDAMRAELKMTPATSKSMMLAAGEVIRNTINLIKEQGGEIEYEFARAFLRALAQHPDA